MLSKLALASYGSHCFTFNFLPFCFVLALLWIHSGRMKIDHMFYVPVFPYLAFVVVEISCFFFLCSLREPIIGPHGFKNVLLGLFSLHLCLFSFRKMIKFYKDIFIVQLIHVHLIHAAAKRFFSQIDVKCVVTIP